MGGLLNAIKTALKVLAASAVYDRHGNRVDIDPGGDYEIQNACYSCDVCEACEHSERVHGTIRPTLNCIDCDPCNNCPGNAYRRYGRHNIVSRQTDYLQRLMRESLAPATPEEAPRILNDMAARLLTGADEPEITPADDRIWIVRD